MEQDVYLLDLKNWSLLDPKPVIYYEPLVDDWFCFWNGVHMTANAALMLTQITIFGSSPCPYVRDALDREFQKYISVGIFNHEWGHFVSDWGGILKFYRYVMVDHIKTYLDHVTPIEAFLWFENYIIGISRRY